MVKGEREIVLTYPSALEMTQQLIKFRTVNPPGNEVSAQLFLKAILEKNGFQVRCYEKIPGRPNLVSRFHGEGKKSPVLFYGHTDVVGVEGQDWDFPPFAGSVHDGLLYGRGALDMKAGVAMLVHTLLKAKANNLRPAGDVILAIVVDEESGGEAGMQYLLQEKPEEFDGIQFAIGEFGGFPLYVFDQKFYCIGVSQKQYAHLRLHLQAPSGHGSFPARDTVLSKLGYTLVKLDELKMPYHKTTIVEGIIQSMIRVLPKNSREILEGLLDPNKFETSLASLGNARRRFEGMFRDTTNPTIVSAGTKFNVIPARLG